MKIAERLNGMKGEYRVIVGNIMKVEDGMKVENGKKVERKSLFFCQDDESRYCTAISVSFFPLFIFDSKSDNHDRKMKVPSFQLVIVSECFDACSQETCMLNMVLKLSFF